MKKTLFVLALFLAVLVSGFLMQQASASVPAERETFMQKEIGAPSGGTSMGPYDSLSVPGASGWLPNEKVPTGSSPVGASNNLSFLLNPKTDTSCCPSAFNTDTGCVCLSDSDKKLMSSRGGNRI